MFSRGFLRLAARAASLALVLVAVAGATALTPGDLGGPVVRIIDGDTIQVRVASRVETIRYIGIDTPEVRHPRRGAEPGGRAATRVNRALVRGRNVRLELDVQARDRHGRLLAYVWVGDLMVNAELVRRGYAEVLTVPPNVRYQTLFLRLQREARESARGLWGGV